MSVKIKAFPLGNASSCSCSIGTSAAEVEGDVRNELKEKKLEKYFVHSLGHGVGLDVHELPSLALRSKDELKENNVFTIEPGVYIPDFGGVRIEDMVVLRKKGPEILTQSKYIFSI